MSKSKPLGKRFRLTTGKILEAWPPHPNEPEVCRLALINERGTYKGVVEFTQQDLVTIANAFNEAAKSAAQDAEATP